MIMTGPVSLNSSREPTDLFVVLVGCRDSQWGAQHTRCADTEQTFVNSFLLPNRAWRRNRNQTPHAYLYENTARVRDIELLTDLRFFDAWQSPEHALLWRLRVNDRLFGWR